MSGFTYSYAFALTEWLTQISVDCNKFNKGEINEVRTENKRRAVKMRTKLTETTLTSIHTNRTKHQNKA